MTNPIAKAAAAAGVSHLPSSTLGDEPEPSLRSVISSQIELLIEILDRLDGDLDAEPDLIEDENLDEAWAQPVSLGPRVGSVRLGRRRAKAFGAAERGQAHFRSDATGDRTGLMAGSTPPLRAVLQPGLRESVRNRLVRHGTDVPTDVELLGALLSLVMPRRDPQTIAHRLIYRFGSFSASLAAPVSQLALIEGMGRASATNLKIILAAAKRFGRDQIDRERPILNSWTQLLDYCRVTMAFEDIEQFRLLLLNKRNCLIADEVQQKGTVDHTPVYPREVIKRSLELSATAIILVHNHPSGDPTPSAADVSMTKEIIVAATPLGIIVHDHIIIGRKGHASLKALRLI
jgi:DNA repair protein RadC